MSIKHSLQRISWIILITSLGLVGCQVPAIWNKADAVDDSEAVGSTVSQLADVPLANVSQRQPVAKESVTQVTEPESLPSPFLERIRNAIFTRPQFIASADRIDTATAAIDSAKSAMRPQISLGVDGGSFKTKQQEGTETTGFVRGSQLLFDGFQAQSRVESERSRLEGTRDERVALAADLAYQVVDAYHQVLLQRELVALAEEDLAAHRSLMAQIKDRVNGRAAAETDLLRAQSRLADADSRMVEARSQLRQAEAVFWERFRQRPGELDAPLSAPLTEPSASRIALQDNPSLAAARAQVESLEAALRAAKARRIPTVALQVSAERNIMDTTTGQDYELFAGLASQYDLYAGGGTKAAIAEADARLREARRNEATLKQELERQLDVALADRDAGADEVEVLQRSVEANKAAVLASFEQFSIGRRGFTELLDAQRDFALARASLANAKTRYAMSRYQVLALTTEILPFFRIDPASLRSPAGSFD